MNDVYNYERCKQDIFTEEGQRMFLKIRDNVHKLLNIAGAVIMHKAIADNTGDVWTMIACVDRLVELEEIEEITNGRIYGQHRVFSKIRG